jgi:hypothetical protein
LRKQSLKTMWKIQTKKFEAGMKQYTEWHVCFNFTIIEKVIDMTGMQVLIK